MLQIEQTNILFSWNRGTLGFVVRIPAFAVGLRSDREQTYLQHVPADFK